MSDEYPRKRSRNATLTFARPVFPRGYDDWSNTGNNVTSDYNPFSPEALAGEAYPESNPRYYAAGWARLKPEFE